MAYPANRTAKKANYYCCCKTPETNFYQPSPQSLFHNRTDSLPGESQFPLPLLVKLYLTRDPRRGPVDSTRLCRLFWMYVLASVAGLALTRPLPRHECNHVVTRVCEVYIYHAQSGGRVCTSLGKARLSACVENVLYRCTTASWWSSLVSSS